MSVDAGEEMGSARPAAVYLSDIRGMMHAYVRALSGKGLRIRGYQGAPSFRQITSPPLSKTDFLFLPDRCDLFEAEEENLSFYRVSAAHQAGHHEFGTYEFSLREVGDLLERMRSLWGERRREEPVGLESDLTAFFRRFPSPGLAREIFRILEDGRVDSRLRHRYKGLRKGMEILSSFSLAMRPDLRSMRLREAALELLLRSSMGAQPEGPLPHPLSPLFKIFSSAHHLLCRLDSTVHQSAIVATTLYSIIEALPDIPSTGHTDGSLVEKMTGLLEEHAEAWRLSLVDGSIPPPLSAISLEFPHSEDEPDQEHLILPDEPLYRIGPAPEGVQKGIKVKKAGELLKRLSNKGIPIPPELLKRIMAEGGEVNIEEVAPGDVGENSKLFVTDLNGIPPLPVSREEEESLRRRAAEIIDLTVKGEMEAVEEPALFYDEWDCLMQDYRARWCRLTEKQVDEGNAEEVRRIMEEHSGEIAVVRRGFQLLKPQLFKKIRNLTHGEEIDLDKAVAAHADKRAGGGSDEKIYQRREKRERQVSTLILLDMSASTDQEINDDAAPAASSSPQDVGRTGQIRSKFDRTMGWSAEHRWGERSRTGKRIVDVEREALVIMAEALESIGDEYAICGFSGYGRDNVEFFLIKDFDGECDDAVRSRISAIRPHRSTRMGPAIRHASEKLHGRRARFKLLLLLSDGYPQDHDYGPDRTSRAYGINDTAMAIKEAHQHKIHTLLITVDPAGNDYLKDICGGSPYVVLNDVRSLPRQLPRAYRRLTA